jgi:hypothetical protein
METIPCSPEVAREQRDARFERVDIGKLVVGFGQLCLLQSQRMDLHDSFNQHQALPLLHC